MSLESLIGRLDGIVCGLPRFCIKEGGKLFVGILGSISMPCALLFSTVGAIVGTKG